MPHPALSPANIQALPHPIDMCEQFWCGNIFDMDNIKKIGQCRLFVKEKGEHRYYAMIYPPPFDRNIDVGPFLIITLRPRAKDYGLFNNRKSLQNTDNIVQIL